MTAQRREEANQEALDRWAELACYNGATDAAVNDLLEEIAGEKYEKYEDYEDPIWEIIRSLSDEELDEFIDGCDYITGCLMVAIRP